MPDSEKYYTTGEAAKLCAVSVRTVQYYDSRGILVPSKLSEGGRRIYTEEDLQKLRIICFLRSLDFSIDSIKMLFSEQNPKAVISLLLGEQEQAVKEELSKLRQKEQMLNDVKKSLGKLNSFSIRAIGDIAYIMENKKKMRKMRIGLTVVGLVMDVIEVATVVLWVQSGIWWPFAVGMPLVVLLGVLATKAYFDAAAYICPECHTVFQPKLATALFAYHTPCTRKLCCPNCSKTSFCVETYQKKHLPIANKHPQNHQKEK